LTILPTRKQRHLLVVCLVLAGVLYRGLIPPGFMPASGEAARHGALLVVCTHGQLGTHGQGAGSPGGASLEQCPFAAAAGPALPSINTAFFFPPAPDHVRADWSAISNRGGSPRLLPPARAPPVLS